MTADVDVEMSAWSLHWLNVDSSDSEDSTVIRVRGGIAGDRAEVMWDAIERALQWAAGGRVVVDLSEVTGFDVHSIEELTDVATAARRRHDDLRAVVKPHSALDHYVRCCSVGQQVPVYDSLTTAIRADSDRAGSACR
jgi:anti-anti-sigma regulatory factor